MNKHIKWKHIVNQAMKLPDRQINTVKYSKVMKCQRPKAYKRPRMLDKAIHMAIWKEWKQLFCPSDGRKGEPA